MYKVKCDICGKEDYYLISIKLPTRCKKWAKDAHGAKLYLSYVTEIRDHKLCMRCCNMIASMMLPCEEEGD